MVTLNWGILGAGNISGQFVHDLVLNNTENDEIKHIVRSIGSSSSKKGHEFIAANKVTKDNNEGVEPVVQSYEEFYKNKDIDVVYVGTPHVFHKNQVEQCLNNDLHVVCEKPFTINSKELESLVALAKEKKKFLMEAVWTRFLPIVQEIQTKIFEEKILGDIQRLLVDFTYNADLENLPPTSRVRNIELGGGALLDIGIYSLTYGRIFLDNKLGKDHTDFDLKSFVTVDPIDKVDFNTSVLMKYKNGKQGILTCANYNDSPVPFGRIEGTKGYIEIFASNPARIRLYKIHLKTGESKEVKDDAPYNGFIHEANAAAIDIHNGRLESSIIPLDESLLVTGIMDRIRKENDFPYPQDQLL